MFKVTVVPSALDEAEDFCKTTMSNNERTFVTGSGWVTFVFHNEEDAVGMATKFSDRLYRPNYMSGSMGSGPVGIGMMGGSSVSFTSAAAHMYGGQGGGHGGVAR